MFGFLFIDKPQGHSSFYYLKVLRGVSGMRRFGFVGTLDPLATGLMIFALGEATKLIPLMDRLDKVYDVLIKLGEVSDTYDVDGKIEIVDKPYKKPARGDVEKLLEDSFIGERMQVPPKYSAIKIAGRRAYDLARKNQKVDLKARKVHFYDIKIKKYAWPHLMLSVHCSSGTYIRSLAHDLGQALGCGGLVKELRRVKIGEYSVKSALKMEDVEKARLNFRSLLVSPADMFQNILHVNLTREEYNEMAAGRYINDVKNMPAPQALAFLEGVCVGVIQKDNCKLKFKRKLNIFS
jgi:tRNA pseudouridine55 synthase